MTMKRSTKLPRRPLSPTNEGRYGDHELSAISEQILDAILDHRLPPGTKLTEEKLASVFKVSRTKIRESLARLSYEGVVSLQPNRGAFVASPTINDARDVLDVRRVIEPELVRQIANVTSSRELAELRTHVSQEMAAHKAADRRSIVRLSGDFHIRLAKLSGNAIFHRVVRELVSVNCLVIALYDSPNVPSCPSHEHGYILDALENNDGKLAAKRMLEHLTNVEKSLNLSDSVSREVDLDAIFSKSTG
jgi:DNA-binding GntR family transcriptional regulator